MDLFEALRTTRAIRRFTTEPISDADVEACLAAAVQGPSGGNIQPYQFLVVRDPELKQRIGAVYLRAWEQLITGKPVGEAIDLSGTGIQITVSLDGDGPPQVGDYWCIAVRPATRCAGLAPVTSETT